MTTQQPPESDTGFRKSLKSFLQATKTFWTGSSKLRRTVPGKDPRRERPSTIHDLDEFRPLPNENLPGHGPGRNLTSARSVPVLRSGAELSRPAKSNVATQGELVRNLHSRNFEPMRGSESQGHVGLSGGRRTTNEPAVRAHQGSSTSWSVSQGTMQQGIASGQSNASTGWPSQSRARNQAADRVLPMASIPEPSATSFFLASDFNQAPRSNTIGSGPTHRRESGILFPGQYFSSAPRSLEMPSRQQLESLETRSMAPNIAREPSPRTRISTRQSIPSLPRLPIPSQAASTRPSRPLPDRYHPNRPAHTRPGSSAREVREVRSRAMTATGYLADRNSGYPVPHQVDPPRLPSSSSTLPVDTAYSSYSDSPNAEAMQQSRMTFWPPNAALNGAPSMQAPDQGEHRDSVLENFRWPWNYRPVEHTDTPSNRSRPGRAVSIGGASFVTASPNAVSRIGSSGAGADDEDHQDEQNHDNHSCWCEECFDWRMKYRLSHHAVGQRLRHVEMLYQEYGDNLQRVFQSTPPEYGAELAKLQHMAVSMKGKRTWMRSILDEDKEFTHMAARLAKLEADVYKANVKLVDDLRAVGKKAFKEQRSE